MKSNKAILRSLQGIILLVLVGLGLWALSAIKVDEAHQAESVVPNRAIPVSSESNPDEADPGVHQDNQDNQENAVFQTVGEALGIVQDNGDRAWVERLEELLAMAHGEAVRDEPVWERTSGVLAGIEPGGPDVLHAVRGFRPVPGIDPAQAGSYRAFYAWHPGQDIQAGVDPVGLAVSADGLRWHLRASSLHIDGVDETLPPVAGRVDTHENLAYLESGRVRQYVANRPEAPEHWMEIDGAGSASGRIALRFDQAGDFALAVSASGDEILLLPPEDDSGVADAALRYHRLKAWDADQREIPAFFEADGQGFSIVLYATQARFPLVIDPLIERATGARLGEFAATVATDIDLVAVGVPGFDYDTAIIDRYQALWLLLQTEFLDVTSNLAFNLFPKPDKVGLAVFVVDKLFNTFLGGPNMVERAERISVLRNIGMVWVFARATERWVLVGTLERIEEARQEAQKYFSGDEVSFDDWRFGEGLAVAGGQLIVGEPGRAYWRVASVPQLAQIVVEAGFIPIPGLGEALAWADGRPIHTSPRRKGRVYVFNHPEYDEPMQVIDGIRTGAGMWGEVGAKIVAEGERAVVFSSFPINPDRGDIIDQDRTVTPSPLTTYWASHHFERGTNNRWTRVRTVSSQEIHSSGSSGFEAILNFQTNRSILEAAALDRHGELWVGAQRPGLDESTLYRVHADGQVTALWHPMGRFALDHWSGGSRTPRSHLIIGRPDDANGRGILRLVDTTLADRSVRPIRLEVEGEPGQMLGQSVAVLDMALLASDGAGRVHGWRDTAEGWRAMTSQEQGELAALRDVKQLSAGRFWVAALTEDASSDKGLEILTAEIPRTISGRLTYRGQPVVGLPVDAMEFIRLNGPGIPIDPFVYFCGTGCTVRDPSEQLHFNPNTGHYIEVANFDFRDHWGTLRNSRRIPLMGLEIEGAPEYRNLRLLGGSMREWVGQREWRFHGNVRPLAPTNAGGFRGADYGDLPEDRVEASGQIGRPPLSPAGWDELRIGFSADGIGPMFPILPSQDRLRLFMYDPLAPSRRETASSGVGQNFVARLAMTKDASTRVFTDDQGRFEITGLRPSHAGLRISRSAEDGSGPVPAGVYRLVSGGGDIDLYGNIAVSGVELVMDAGGYGFSGRVAAGGDPSAQTFQFSSAESRFNANQPVTVNRQPGLSGLTVRATNQSNFDFSVTTTTGADGRYSFSDIPPGDYRVEFINLPAGWGAVSPQTVRSRYQGQTDQQEYVYRQRGASTNNVNDIIQFGVPVDHPNPVEVSGALAGNLSGVIGDIRAGLPSHVGGLRIQYEYARPTNEVEFRQPYPGYPELKALRPVFTGADAALQGTRQIVGSAPLPGTRIRWHNSLGQGGVVVAVGGQFQLNGMAPAIYQFEVSGNSAGYASTSISLDLRNAMTGAADFRFENSGAIRFTGVDAWVSAGLAVDDPVLFGNRVRIISRGDDVTAASGALSIPAQALTPGQEFLTLPVSGLKFREELVLAQTQFGRFDSQNWRSVLLTAGESKTENQTFAVLQMESSASPSATPRLVIHLGNMGSAGGRFELVDPAGTRHHFEFHGSGQEVLEIDFKEAVPAIGRWQLRLVNLSWRFSLIEIKSVELQFVEVDEAAASFGRASLVVAGAPAGASVFEWVDPEGRAYPMVVPASVGTGERSAVRDWLPPVNGDWRLRVLQAAPGLEIKRAEVTFPNSGTVFSTTLNGEGDGIAGSVPTGSYWIEMEPRLMGGSQAVFVAPRWVDVVADQTREIEVRGEPVQPIGVEVIDGLGEIRDASLIGGRLFLESPQTPGLCWPLTLDGADGRRFTGIAPWWVHTTNEPEAGRMILLEASPRWRQIETAGDAVVRQNPERIPLRVVENAIRGVLEDRGSPLANIHVVLDSGESTTTDAEGRFEFVEPPPGPRTISFALDGIPPVTVENTGLITVIRMARPTLPMTGRVVRQNGVPVPDAKVKIEGNGESLELPTDGSGRFRFVLPSGFYSISFEKDYYEESSVFTVLHEEGATELGDLLLPRLLQNIEGVVTRDGQPMAGVQVQLWGSYYWASFGEPFEPIERTTVTNASGQYLFEDVPAGTFRITPRMQGFAFAPSFSEYGVFVPNSGSSGFEAFGGQIRGRVLARSQPYGGFIMELRNNSNQLLATAVSGEDGFFEFSSQQPGAYRISQVVGQGNRLMRVAGGVRTAEITGNTEVDVGDFELELAGFSGQLLDELGDVIAHGTLRIDGPESVVIETDGEGRWERTILAGSYQFSVDAAGVSFTNLNRPGGLDGALANNENSRTITGFRGGEMSGLVLRNGQPVAGQTVYLGPKFSRFPFAETVTDAEGRYHFSRLPRQIHTVHLRFPQGQEMNVIRDQPSGGPGGIGDVSSTRGVLEVGAIEISAPAHISGVVEWDGQPMENALVTITGGAQQYGNPRTFSVPTGRNGRFSLRLLAGDDYQLTVAPVAESTGGQFNGIGLADQDDLRFELIADRSNTWRFFVVQKDNPNLEADFASNFAPPPPVVHVNGRQIEGVVSGKWVSFTYSTPDRIRYDFEAEIPAGYAPSWYLQAQGQLNGRFQSSDNARLFDAPLVGNAVISGEVARFDGVVVSGWPVELWDSNGMILETRTTDANGGYRFTSLFPGKEYRLEFGQRGGRVGEIYHMPLYLHTIRTSDEPGVSETQLPTMILYTDPQPFWLPIEGIYEGEPAPGRAWNLEIPVDKVAPDQAYACAFWVKAQDVVESSQGQWRALEGISLGLRAGGTHDWQLLWGSLMDTDGTRLTLQNEWAFPRNRWLHLGFQVHAAVDGIRRMVVYRFGIPVDEFAIPVADFTEPPQLYVRVVESAQFGGFEFIPELLSLDEWRSLPSAEIKRPNSAKVSLYGRGPEDTRLEHPGGYRLVGHTSRNYNDLQHGTRLRLVEGESGEVTRIWHDYWQSDQIRKATISTAGYGINGAGHQQWNHLAPGFHRVDHPLVQQIEVEVEPLVLQVQPMGQPGQVWKSGESRKIRVWLNHSRKEAHRILSKSDNPMINVGTVYEVHPGQDWIDLDVNTQPSANIEHAIIRIGNFLSGEPTEMRDERALEWPSVEIRTEPTLFPVTGRIVDANGIGLAGIEVRGLPGGGRTDTRGNFSFAPFSGSGTINYDINFGGWQFEGPGIEVVNGSYRQNVVVTDGPVDLGNIVARGNFKVRGRLLNLGPSGPVTVGLRGPGNLLLTRQTFADGFQTYEFTDLPPGDYVLFLDGAPFSNYQIRQFTLTDNDVSLSWIRNDFPVELGVQAFTVSSNRGNFADSRGVYAGREFQLHFMESEPAPVDPGPHPDVLMAENFEDRPTGTLGAPWQVSAPSGLVFVIGSSGRLIIEGGMSNATAFLDLDQSQGQSGTTSWIRVSMFRTGEKDSPGRGPGGSPSWIRPVNFALFEGSAERLAVGEGTRNAEEDDDVWGLLIRGDVNDPGTVWTDATLGEPTTALVRIDHGAADGNDRAWLWINPSWRVEPEIAQAAAETTGNFRYDRIRLFAGGAGSGGAGASGLFDDFAIATSWEGIQSVAGLTGPVVANSVDFDGILADALEAGRQLAIVRTPSERFRVQAMLAAAEGLGDEQVVGMGNYWIDLDGDSGVLVWGDGEIVDTGSILGADTVPARQVIGLGRPGFQLAATAAPVFAGYIEERVPMTGRITAATVPQEDLRITLSSSHPELVRVPDALLIRGQSSGGTLDLVEFPIYINSTAEKQTHVVIEARVGTNQVLFTQQVVVRPPRIFSGRVTDITGQGLEGLAVSDGFQFWPTDADGRFRVEASDPEKTLNIRPVVTLEGATTSPVQYTRSYALMIDADPDFLITGSETLSGRIESLNQPAAESVALRIGEASFPSQSGGAFAIPGLLGREYVVRPELDGYRFEPEQAVVTLGDGEPEELVFQAIGLLEVAGTVRADGSPLAGAQVIARLESGIEIVSTLTLGNGSFVLAGLSSAGNYELLFRARGYGDQVISGAALAAGPLSLNLVENRLSGTLLRADGGLFANASVTVNGTTITTGADGRFSFSRVPAGEIEMIVSGGQVYHEALIAMPDAGGVVENVDIRLPSRIGGRVTDEAGEPLVNVGLVITAEEAPDLPPIPYQMDLLLDPTLEFQNNRREFHVEREGAVEHLELSFVLSGGGAERAALWLNTPRGSFELLPVISNVRHPVDPDGKVRLRFSTRSSEASNADFKRWFEQNLKGHDMRGLWIIELNVTRRFVPTLNRFVDWTNQPVTLETLEVNPLTLSEPVGITVFTDEEGRFMFDPQPGTHVVEPSGSTEQLGFAPNRVVADTRVGPVHLDFVGSIHPAIQWAVPEVFLIDRDDFASLKVANASVPGAFTFIPDSADGLTLGENTLTLRFTPDSSSFPVRELTRVIEVRRLETPFEVIMNERAHGLPEALRSPLADASGDGIPNLVAAFVGRDVLGGSAQPPVIRVLAADGPVGVTPIIINVPEGVGFVPASQPYAIWSGHRITIEAGTDLGKFDHPTKIVPVPVGAPVPPTRYSQRAFALDGAVTDRGFFRLRVEAEPE